MRFRVPHPALLAASCWILQHQFLFVRSWYLCADLRKGISGELIARTGGRGGESSLILVGPRSVLGADDLGDLYGIRITRTWIFQQASAASIGASVTFFALVLGLASGPFCNQTIIARLF